jgi:SAM-dependent methyltransferase
VSSPSLDPLIERYREAFRQHGNSPDAVLWPKGRQHLRFEALTSHFPRAGFSVLDFGCGLGHLKSYLDARHRDFRYHGVDVVPEFIAECSRTFPGSSFTRINSHAEVGGSYDYVVMSGAFNLLYLPEAERHQGLVFEILEHLFQFTQSALSCDFMTDKVDFRQPGAFHMSEPALVGFIRDRLSPRYVLDHSYMPYEFAARVFKDQRILRPANIYHGTPDGNPAA